MLEEKILKFPVSICIEQEKLNPKLFIDFASETRLDQDAVELVLTNDEVLPGEASSP